MSKAIEIQYVSVLIAPSDIFIGLNVIRALSIISLLLVFSSSILVMVEDIKAVNAFMSAKQTGNFDNSTISSDMIDCDYIECVALHVHR